ncbi:hypothetical protein HU200_044018 [Digitaria exilis]|uniref:Uncharacterized protein n=1 Tax=Digitaria exilis TaxID=1010633 RepID=A0A835BDC1_9POAL|nr:hypothetical protein HU200_044018 [Digitaria exilis]
MRKCHEPTTIASLVEVLFDGAYGTPAAWCSLSRSKPRNRSPTSVPLRYELLLSNGGDGLPPLPDPSPPLSRSLLQPRSSSQTLAALPNDAEGWPLPAAHARRSGISRFDVVRAHPHATAKHGRRNSTEDMTPAGKERSSAGMRETPPVAEERSQAGDAAELEPHLPLAVSRLITAVCAFAAAWNVLERRQHPCPALPPSVSCHSPCPAPSLVRRGAHSLPSTTEYLEEERELMRDIAAQYQSMCHQFEKF